MLPFCLSQRQISSFASKLKWNRLRFQLCSLTTEAKINGKLRAILKLEPVSSHFQRLNQLHTVKKQQTLIY